MAKFSLANKFRNLGCIGIAVVVFLILAVSATVVVRETYDQRPEMVRSYTQALELQGKSLARKLAPVIESANAENSGLIITASLAQLLANATDTHNWLYVELNLHRYSLKYLAAPELNASETIRKPAAVPDNSPESAPASPPKPYTLQSVGAVSNGIALPVSDSERHAIWNTLLRLGPYRRIVVRNRHKILTVAVLVRKSVRKRMPYHGFLLIQFDFSGRKKNR